MTALTSVLKEKLYKIKLARPLLLVVGYGMPFIGAFATIKILILMYGVSSYGTYVFAFGAAVLIRILTYNIAQPVLIRFYNSFEAAGNLVPALNVFVVATIAALLSTITFWGLSTFPFGCITIGSVPCAFEKIFAGLALGVGLGSATTIAEIDNANCNQTRGALFLSAIPLIQILAVFLCAYMSLPITTYVVVTGALCAVLAVSNAWLIKKNVLIRSRGDDKANSSVQAARKLALGLSTWIIPTLITRALDKTIFGIHLTAIDLATYAVCLLLTQNVLQAINTVLVRLFNPLIFSVIDESNEQTFLAAHRAINGLSLLTGAIGVVLALIYFTLAERILVFVGSEELFGEGWLLQIMSVAACLQAVGDAQSLHGQVRRRTAPFFVARCAGAITFIAGALLILPSRGLMGAAITIAISQVVGAICNVIAGFKVQSKSTH